MRPINCYAAESEEGRQYKWEIAPHPESNEADILVCDDDNEALGWLLSIAENVWDGMEPGETKTITITCNAVGKPGEAK